jgi:para-nitrobenzyl esterase
MSILSEAQNGVSKNLSRWCSIAIFTGGLFAFGTSASADDLAAPILHIKTGTLKGITGDGVDKFLGIPYAAPPVGELRWRPPQTPKNWHGLLNATAFGNTCPQNNEMGVFASPSETEDCLYLNVFVPHGASASHAKLPVMVWIYGGALIDGESNDYDGSKLARDGNVIVVSMNYRVGILGFFAQSQIDAEGHLYGSYGLMDQRFALKWVQANIAAFGGDARNVTLFGQSAGAYSAVAQLVTPSSRGLFSKVIIESGPLLKPVAFSTALAHGNGFAAAAHCTSPNEMSQCLRGLTVKQILALQGSYTTNVIIDGTYIPEPPDVALESGRFNHVPLIDGTAFDEGRFATAIGEYGTKKPLTTAAYDESTTAAYGAVAGKVLALYPVEKYGSPALAFAENMPMLGADVIACSRQEFDEIASKWVPVYSYSFDYRDAPSYFPAMSFPMGAYHTVELQFLFPGYHGGQGIPHRLDAAERDLSDKMTSLWAGFAHMTKNTLPWPESVWPQFKPTSDDYLSLNIPASAVKSGAGFTAIHHCTFWDSVTAY